MFFSLGINVLSIREIILRKNGAASFLCIYTFTYFGTDKIVEPWGVRCSRFAYSFGYFGYSSGPSCSKLTMS